MKQTGNTHVYSYVYIYVRISKKNSTEKQEGV